MRQNLPEGIPDVIFVEEFDAEAARRNAVTEAQEAGESNTPCAKEPNILNNTPGAHAAEQQSSTNTSNANAPRASSSVPGGTEICAKPVNAPAIETVHDEPCLRCRRAEQGKPPVTFGQVHARRADLIILKQLCEKQRAELDAAKGFLHRGNIKDSPIVSALIAQHLFAERVCEAFISTPDNTFPELIDALAESIQTVKSRVENEDDDDIKDYFSKQFSPKGPPPAGGSSA